MAYSKGDFAKSLGISRGELEKRAKDAGYSTTEEYYNATRGTGTTEQQQIGDFMTRWRDTISNQPTISDIWNRIQSEKGIDQARNLYTGLRGSAMNVQEQFENAPEAVAGETRGFDVNASQLARIQQARQGEIAKTLTPIARSAEQAGTVYNTLVQQGLNELGLEQYQLEKELQPFQTEAELLNSALARQLSYYTVDQERQTNMLIEKLKGENALSLEELEQLGDLAQLEKQYQDQLAYFNATKTAGSTGYTFADIENDAVNFGEK